MIHREWGKGDNTGDTLFLDVTSRRNKIDGYDW